MSKDKKPINLIVMGARFGCLGIVVATVIWILIITKLADGVYTEVRITPKTKTEVSSVNVKTDTVYLNIEIDSQEVAVGYLKSNGAFKNVTN